MQPLPRTVTQGTGRHLLPSNTQSCQQPVISANIKKKKCFPRLDPSLDFTCFMKVIWKWKFKTFISHWIIWRKHLVWVTQLGYLYTASSHWSTGLNQSWTFSILLSDLYLPQALQSWSMRPDHGKKTPMLLLAGSGLHSPVFPFSMTAITPLSLQISYYWRKEEMVLGWMNIGKYQQSAPVNDDRKPRRQSDMKNVC